MRTFITKNNSFSSFNRALIIIIAFGVLVTGITFAALQSQQVALGGNSIQSATAGLLISTASPTATDYSSSHPGFSFANLIPGGPAVPDGGNSFYLKNSGTAPLGLKVAVSTTPTNATNVDLSKVNVTITRDDTNTTQTTNLQALISGYATGGVSLTDPLAPAATGTKYQIGVSMSADAFSGTSAAIGNIDFVFSGTGTAVQAA